MQRLGRFHLRFLHFHGAIGQKLLPRGGVSSQIVDSIITTTMFRGSQPLFPNSNAHVLLCSSLKDSFMRTLESKANVEDHGTRYQNWQPVIVGNQDTDAENFYFCK